MTELDAARLIATGELASPTPFGNFVLWSIRITGTGYAERTARNETVWRDAADWLNPETLARCAGLPLVLDHPKGGVLNSKEFGARAIGNVLLPYIGDRQGIQNDANPDQLGPDVWAVVRCYDDEANRLMSEQTVSTSPAVVFKPSDGVTTVATAQGHLLLENTPSLIDHIALCHAGVWGPGGVRNDLKQEKVMADSSDDEPMAEQPGADAGDPPEKKSDTEFPGQKLDKMLSTLDAMSKRMDSWEAADKKRRADAAEGERARIAADSQLRPKTYSEQITAENAERSSMHELQARADSIFMGFNLRAPAPMSGERLIDYRVRLARQMQRWSPGFGKVDLGRIKDTGDGFTAIEDQIYADGLAAANDPNCLNVPGVMREVVKVNPATGQRMIQFYGDESFIGQMKRPGRRIVGFNTKNPQQ